MLIKWIVRIDNNQSRFFNFFNELESDLANARKEKQKKLQSRDYSWCKIKRKA